MAAQAQSSLCPKTPVQIQTEVSSASLSEHAWPAPGLSWVLRQEAAEGGLAGQRGGAPTLSGHRRSDVVGALQQGGDGVLQGHGHLLGGLAQQRAVGVVLLEVEDVALLALGRAAALLAHVQLGPPLLVCVLLLHTVDLLEVGLQRAALREGLVTQAALVGPHTCVGAHMPLEVEGVVEALPAVSAEMPLDVIVALHVAVQHALVGEGLLADVAGEEVSAGTVPQRYLHLGAQKAMVSALRACQAAHVFGGQLGHHAGPGGHTIAGVPKAHVQSQGARRGFGHRGLWFLVGLWRAEAQADWHVDLAALLVGELAPVPLARGDARLLY